jgi:hypothetical protein
MVRLYVWSIIATACDGVGLSALHPLRSVYIRFELTVLQARTPLDSELLV